MAESKYTEENIASIVELLEKGALKKDAALLSGLTEETFYNWQRPKLANNETPNPDYHPEFSELVERAIATYRNTLIKAINVNVIKNGSLALETLARRFPDDFGEKRKIEIDTAADRLQRVFELINGKKDEQIPDTGK